MYDISVIIPVHNAEKTISDLLNKLLLESVIAQIQIILVENGSKDKSKEICLDYANQYGNISCISLKKGNVSKARNVGMRNAQGLWISFIDADDDFVKGTYEILLKYLRRVEEDVCIFDYMKRIGDKKISASDLISCLDVKEGAIPAELIEENFLGPQNADDVHYMASVWRGIFRKSFLQRNNISMDESVMLGEDLLFWIRVLHYIDNIYYIDKKLYIYNFREDSQSNRSDYNKWMQFDILFSALFRTCIDMDTTRQQRIGNKIMEMYTWSVAEIVNSNIPFRKKRKVLAEARKSLVRQCNSISIPCNSKDIKIVLIRGKQYTLLVLLGQAIRLKQWLFQKL